MKERTVRKKIAHSLGIEDEGPLFCKRNQPRTHKLCGGGLRKGIRETDQMKVVWCPTCHKIIEKLDEENGDISPLRAAIAASDRCC